MRIALLAASILSLSVTACAEGGAPDGPSGPGVAIEVAPLSLSSVSNARYRLVVENASTEVVADVTVTADQYGDGAGSISYVMPCDADDNDNVVKLTLLDLYEGGSATPMATDLYVNPGTLSRTVTCEADADVSVVFDLTIARDASQGFFDVAIELDQIFCSAKLDCLKDPADPTSTIELLFNGSERDTTFVMGFACTGGLGEVETWQYLNDVNVTCGADTVLVDVGAGVGTLPASAITQVAGTQNPLFGAAVFRGTEEFAIYDKQYWNVALGFDAGASCHVSALGTASNGELPASTTPAGSTWPLIVWDVNLTDAAGAIACTQHPVNDAATCPGYGVCVDYTDLDAPEAFDNAFYAAALPPGVPIVLETFSFTTCGQTGRSGPDQAACDAAYAGTSLEGDVTVTAGYQRWMAPTTGTYQITARGARGGHAGTGLAALGGYGAEVYGELDLNAGDELVLLVGQAGQDKEGCFDWGGGGGGGSFVTRIDAGGDALAPLGVNVTPLIIAGAGAGANDDGITNGGCTAGSQTRSSFHGLATQSGSGGGGTADGEGGGGAGYSGAGGVQAFGTGNQSFLAGGTGGDSTGHANGLGGTLGGFGGGGAGWNTGGGGGGYTGGSLDTNAATFGQSGGYSYNVGANPSGTDAAVDGPGTVEIVLMGTSGTVSVTNALTTADPGRWSDGSVADSCEGYIRPSGGETPATTSGTYTIDPDGAAATFGETDVYCDMTGDGGGWTLVQVGLANNSANLMTDLAVNGVATTIPAASGKLSRAAMAAIATDGEIRYGHSDYGYLYLANLPAGAFTTPSGTPGYTTPDPVVPNVASLSWGGATSTTTLFDWPANSIPDVCSNIGVTGECGPTPHIGRWSSSRNDSAYTNDFAIGQHLDYYYQIWVK